MSQTHEFPPFQDTSKKLEGGLDSLIKELDPSEIRIAERIGRVNLESEKESDLKKITGIADRFIESKEPPFDTLGYKEGFQNMKLVFNSFEDGTDIVFLETVAGNGVSSLNRPTPGMDRRNHPFPEDARYTLNASADFDMMLEKLEERSPGDVVFVEEVTLSKDIPLMLGLIKKAQEENLKLIFHSRIQPLSAGGELGRGKIRENKLKENLGRAGIKTDTLQFNDKPNDKREIIESNLSGLLENSEDAEFIADVIGDNYLTLRASANFLKFIGKEKAGVSKENIDELMNRFDETSNFMKQERTLGWLGEKAIDFLKNLNSMDEFTDQQKRYLEYLEGFGIVDKDEPGKYKTHKYFDRVVKAKNL